MSKNQNGDASGCGGSTGIIVRNNNFIIKISPQSMG